MTKGRLGMKQFKHLKKLTAITLCAVAFTSSAFAAEKKKAVAAEPAPAPEAAAKEGETGEVDISDIQNQYWKAHDKQFEVIQNKQYTKKGRFEFAPLVGMYQRVDFQDTKTAGASLSYHFSEMWGAEIMGYKAFTSDSSVLTRFKETRGATIEFNEEKYYFGAHAMFTPIYAKFSFLGIKISHFDMYISPGLGVTKTNANRFTQGVGVGQKFWLSPKFNIRWEYRWLRYGDRINTSEGATAVRNGGPGYYNDTVNNQNLMIGVGFLF
jgi:outer membrane beta-barrel protein